MSDFFSHGSFEKGKWRCTNLNFLVKFMEAEGIDTGMIARKLGYERPTVTAWLRNDNILLSKAYAIINAFDYDLRFGYIMPDVNITENNMTITIECNDKSFNGEKRLSFLSHAIARKGLTLQELAGMVGVSRQTVSKWLKEDDISIKYIILISKLLGYETQCNITPKK